MKNLLFLVLFLSTSLYAEMGVINYTPPDVTAIKAKTDNLPADTATQLTTIETYAHSTEEHLHSSSKVYPTLANGVQVTGAAGAWTLGNYSEIVPINTITSPFDIHYINVSNASAADTYELVLYAATSEIARVRFTKSSNNGDYPLIPILSPVQLANTQIQAKVASSSGNDNVTISIYYHTY